MTWRKPQTRKAYNQLTFKEGNIENENRKISPLRIIVSEIDPFIWDWTISTNNDQHTVHSPFNWDLTGLANPGVAMNDSRILGKSRISEFSVVVWIVQKGRKPYYLE